MKTIRFLLPIILVFISTNAYAGYTVDSGLHTIISPPPPVISRTDTTPRSTTNWFFFEEQQNVTLTSDIFVDGLYPAAGVYDAPTDLSPGNLPSGTTVSSYFLFAQSGGNASNQYSYAGQITFTDIIIGLQRSRDTIRMADNSQISLAFDYDVGNYNFTNESFTISPDKKTINFTFLNGSGMDNLRIITEASPMAVPEPKTYLLLSFALLGTLFLYSRKLDKKSSNTHS